MEVSIQKLFFLSWIGWKKNQDDSLFQYLKERFLKPTHLDFQTRVSPKLLTCFVSSSSASNVFSFCWNIYLKVISFHYCNGILMEQGDQKKVLVLTYLDILAHICYALPASFFFIMSQHMNAYNVHKEKIAFY